MKGGRRTWMEDGEEEMEGAESGGRPERGRERAEVRVPSRDG